MEGSQNGGVSFGRNSIAEGLSEDLVLRIVDHPDPCSWWSRKIDRYIFLGAIDEEQDNQRIVKVIVMLITSSNGKEDEEAMWKVISATFAEGDSEKEAWKKCQKGLVS
jgi:hypothetical protein